jgi:hypothetical protein
VNRLLFLVVLIIFPCMANASDPTPLIEIFIEWPLLFLSAILCFFSFLKSKNSLVFNLVLLLFHILILSWLTEAGYMRNHGEMIWLSLTINIIGIGLGAYKVSCKKRTDNST